MTIFQTFMLVGLALLAVALLLSAGEIRRLRRDLEQEVEWRRDDYRAHRDSHFQLTREVNSGFTELGLEYRPGRSVGPHWSKP